jgi:radical SAM protein with 4Fe4S-binding SPASM domain
MENIIIVLILVMLAAGIVFYLIRAKRRGEKCIGCPYAKQCEGKCGSNNR